MAPLAPYYSPSLQWIDQKFEDGDYSKSVEARLTLDRKFYSDLSRSSIALLYLVSDELDSSGQTKETDIGILHSIYLMTGPNSTLTLVYEYWDWDKKLTDEDGVNTIIILTWKVIF
jgi:hypothetical protein